MATPRGKIGRLPEALRAQLNGKLRDNNTAEDIIAWLESNGITGITPQNISTWKKWGYEKWLKRMDRLEDMASRREFARQLVREANDEGRDALTVAGDAASAMAVETITDVLEDFDVAALRTMLAEKPEKFMDLIHALAAARKGDQSAVLLRQKVEEYERQRKQLSEVIEKNGVATKEDFDAIYRDAYGVKPGA
ncbi:MAG: DUF3486 family protein [Kiritimatiellaeota bacterium]|nr:DUF3486 family protein [Kiritimatiellota bacterium]